jgi:hypothetical protein
MAVSSVGVEEEKSKPFEEACPPSRETAHGRPRDGAMDRKVSQAVAEAFVHRAAPGGIPDERFLAEPANFAELVRLDVKGMVAGGSGSPLGCYLRAPNVVGRWESVLREIERDVDAQLFRRPGGADGWRDAAEKFLRHVRRRLAEARQIGGAVRGLRSSGQPEGGACDAGTFDRLTGVGRYLVEETRLPEAEREELRERAIASLSKVTRREDARDDAGRGRVAG